MRVLLVEDEVADQESILDILEHDSSLFIVCTVVDTCESAISAIKNKEPFDCIILDRSLPDVSGHEGLKKIRLVNYDIPIVILTGLDETSIGLEALEAGADDYLSKNNLSDDRLRQSVRFAIERRKSRNLERHLAQSQRLESIGKLSGGIAHDFNNIITIISLLTTRLIRSEKIKGNELKQINTIFESCKRATKLTKQMLSLARPQSDKLEFLDIPESVEAFMPSLEAMVGRDTKVVLDIKEDCESAYANVVPTLIEQVLLNLVVNAKDALGEDPQIHISVSCHSKGDELFQKHPEIDSSGSFIKITVRDNGSGISKETMKKVFDPFYTTKDVGKGTGLGLSVVHGTVTHLGGYIFVASTLGEGSTFDVLLPRKFRKKKEEKAVIEVKEDVLEGLKLLVVDDEPILAKTIAALLGCYGAETVVRNSGKEVLLDLADIFSFDAIVTDIRMPEVNGIQMALEIQKLDPEARFVFLSGFSDSHLLEKLSEINKFSFLEKPCSPENVVESIVSLNYKGSKKKSPNT